MVKEIAFVCYPVSDMARARAFYEEVFGLKPTTVFGVDGDESQWVEYVIGVEGAFALGKHATWKPSRDGVSAALEVDNFDEVIEKLKARSMEFKVEKSEFPTCHMAAVYDTEGNVITVHKRK